MGTSRAAVAGRRGMVRAQGAGVGACEREQSRQPQVLARGEEFLRHPEMGPGKLETALPGVDGGAGEMKTEVQVRVSGYGRRSRTLVDQAGRDGHAHDVHQLAGDVEADPACQLRVVGRLRGLHRAPKAVQAARRLAVLGRDHAEHGVAAGPTIRWRVGRPENAPGCARCCRAVARPLQHLRGCREMVDPRPVPRRRFHPLEHEAGGPETAARLQSQSVIEWGGWHALPLGVRGDPRRTAAMPARCGNAPVRAEADVQTNARVRLCRPRARIIPAATYSPTKLPPQYHRRWRA